MDEATAICPMSVPAYLLISAAPRRVSFSSSVVSLCRGLSLAQVRFCSAPFAAFGVSKREFERFLWMNACCALRLLSPLQVAATFETRAMTCFRSFVPQSGEPRPLPPWLWVRLLRTITCAREDRPTLFRVCLSLSAAPAS